ncbi:MAG: glycosyltransferase family 1 protein [Anaerolineae bacterium]|nr:glycosyltransferase family 1 protein [Anaerolineae bacterium]
MAGIRPITVFIRRSSLNIFIVTAGSRGDVQPYVALGKGLQAAGHAVTVCTCESFEPFITEHGLSYGYMNDDFIRLVDSEAGRKAMGGGDNPLNLVKSMIALMKDAKTLNRAMMRDAWNAAQKAAPDIVIFHPKALAGSHIAEKLGVPAILALPVPAIVPTGDYAAVGFPDLRLGRWYNKLTFKILLRGYHSYDDVVNEFRQDVLGLGKYPKSTTPMQMADGSPIPVLHGYSPIVWPRPTDWPATAYVTGYWFLDQDEPWQPPAALEEFLAAGDPPVYVGFGSMAGRNPERITNIVVQALQQARVRGIIATGWGGLSADDLPDTILKIDQAPHDWLFPQVAAVVHHGGAGTTAAGLRAGKPSVICPFLVDQPLWGARVHALGAGPKPIPQKKLTAEKLAAAITEATFSPVMRVRAEQVGQQIRDEDGIGTAVSLIEK